MKKRIVLLISMLLVGVFALPLVACKKDANEIIIGASALPHAEILRQAVKPMSDKGYKLTIKEIDGYTTMNNSVVHKDLDANYFQHKAFLDDFNAETSNDLRVLVSVHYEPLGIYKGKKDTLSGLNGSDKIIIPNDTTNMQRALKLLVANGILEYKGSGSESDKGSYSGLGGFDASNIDTVDAALVPNLADEGALVVANGNVALNAWGVDKLQGLRLANETPELGRTYANLVAVRKDDLDNEAMLALKEVLTSESIAQFITDNYNGVVLPL